MKGTHGCPTSVLHPCGIMEAVSTDALEDGQVCPYCGTPVFFHGEGMVDCLNCGAEFVNAEDDPADDLEGEAVDDLVLDNDPDMLREDDGSGDGATD